MPLLANAKKALRVAKRKAVVNTQVRSRVKTAVDAMKKQPTLEKLNTAFSSLDKAVKGKIMHKNRASRLKSQLSKLVKNAVPAAKAAVAKAAPAKVATKKAAPKTAKKAAKK